MTGLKKIKGDWYMTYATMKGWSYVNTKTNKTVHVRNHNNKWYVFKGGKTATLKQIIRSGKSFDTPMRALMYATELMN